MMRGIRSSFLLLFATILHATPPTGNAVSWVRDALAAETRLDTRRALELFLAAEKNRPEDPFILRKIARQYSDLVVDLPERQERLRAVEQAFFYARRAVALDPRNAESVLSLAVCHGKLALLSGTRGKVEGSRQVRELTEQALALDPNYAWAYHLLGRWHSEVSELSSTAKFLVLLFYGGLPPASSTEAVRHLERAVELEPTQLQHWLELGFAYRANGDSARAREAFATGLAMPSREKHDEPAKERARAALREIR